jgi:transposase-like protein
MGYTETFKAEMVKRMIGPPALSAAALAKQVGVAQPTLSLWLRQARRVAAMKPEEKTAPVNAAKKWTAEEKLRVLAAAYGLEGEELGALLRREGLHESQLKAWQQSAAGALASTEGACASGPLTAGQRRRLAVSEKRVKELERELRRKEKALAEAGALLFLEKKLQAMGWDERYQADEDDAADEPSEK